MIQASILGFDVRFLDRALHALKLGEDFVARRPMHEAAFNCESCNANERRDSR